MTHAAALTITHGAFYPGLALATAALLIYISNGHGHSGTTAALSLAALPLLVVGIPGFIVRRTNIFRTQPSQDQPRPLSRATLAQSRAEADRARRKYPEHTANTHHDWLRAATEELGECSKTIHNGGMTQDEMDHLREEVLQLAATALNWADAADFSPTEPGQRA